MPTRRSPFSRRVPLPDRSVVITGAASGIGAATAARLRAAGWNVIGVDKDKADIVSDLATPGGRQEAVALATEQSGGKLAGVVTCAGLAGTPDRAGSLLASVNYFGTVDVLEGLRPLLGAGGAAVAISSNSTTVQPAIPADLVDACLSHDEERSGQIADAHGSLVTYPASKLAVAHWVRRQATGPDWAGAGLRLNAIAPGMIDTPMIAGMRADPEAGPLLDMLPIPVGRPGRPEEIAALVDLLLGPDGAFFCGSVVFCDGGSDALLRTDDWPAAWDISVRNLGQQLS
ncbi:MAG TPA: SDR family oxidoreductase [Acidimicrobiales bacterium]|jgi:NAD(P)-dependent dehydrogenase (short-subunit alcohol dehydrogenase family)|nr:SDR family oxidoreductase [Acidimicrobiales bacterium]